MLVAGVVRPLPQKPGILGMHYVSRKVTFPSGCRLTDG